MAAFVLRYSMELSPTAMAGLAAIRAQPASAYTSRTQQGGSWPNRANIWECTPITLPNIPPFSPRSTLPLLMDAEFARHLDSELMVKQDEGPISGKQPRAPPSTTSRLATGSRSSTTFRSNMSCGRRTAMPTGWQTWPWIAVWAGRRPPPRPRALPRGLWRLRPPGPGQLPRLVKGGVVHVLGGELPDGTFVKVIPE